MTKEAEIITEIRDFFSVQRELYGSKRLLNHKISTEKTISIAPSSTNKQALEHKSEAKKRGPLHDFYFQIRECKKCPLGTTRTHFVFGAGNPKAELMFIGEAPGRDEDIQGIPFVGRAGQLLTLMLQAIQLRREDVFIANVLKCRPPNNRDPLPEEIDKCEPYLMKQIELIAPKLIVTLGRFASASLLRTKAALGTLREDIHYYNNVPLIVTYHPAALLRNPQLKKNAWEDLKKILVFLKQGPEK